jgi:hypothetical protein
VQGGAVRSDPPGLPAHEVSLAGCHRPTAIERHLLEQAAMFISPMSALKRISDSTRTASRVGFRPGMGTSGFTAGHQVICPTCRRMTRVFGLGAGRDSGRNSHFAGAKIGPPPRSDKVCHIA